jgi:hypothetical protein
MRQAMRVSAALAFTDGALAPSSISRTPRDAIRVLPIVLTAAIVVGWASTASAEGADTEAHRAVMSLSYQYSLEQNLIASHFVIPTQPITGKSLDLAIDYALNDHWTVTAALLWIEKKVFDPFRSHDPLRMIPPHTEADFVDDGQFHGYLQDLRVGATYLALVDPIVVEPYVTATTPASQYPFFANAGIGTRVRRLEVGSTIGYRPPFLPWYFSLRVGYSYAHKVLGFDVDASRVDGEAVYFVNPRISIKTFFSSKNGQGVVLPVTPPAPDFTSEFWYQHDRFIRHNYITNGVGMDWKIDNRNSLSMSWIRMAHPEDIFDIKKAYDVTLSRQFGSAVPAARHGLPRSRPISTRQ